MPKKRHSFENYLKLTLTIVITVAIQGESDLMSDPRVCDAK